MLQLNRENPITQLKQKISVKVEEVITDEDNPEYLYRSDIDSFDKILYEGCLRNADINKNYFIKFDIINCFRFKFSQNIYLIDYRDPLGVELFDNLSTASSFKSRDLGIVNRTGFKKLSPKTREPKIGKNHQVEYNFTDEDHSVKKQPEIVEPEKKQEPSVEKKEVSEEVSFRLIKKKSSVGFQPSYAVKTSELGVVFGGISSVNIQKLDYEDITKIDDSVYHSSQESKNKNSLRPSFVDDLFNKYGYEEIDPWKKAQKKTKNNALCLFEIKSIYNKICSLFS